MFRDDLRIKQEIAFKFAVELYDTIHVLRLFDKKVGPNQLFEIAVIGREMIGLNGNKMYEDSYIKFAWNSIFDRLLDENKKRYNFIFIFDELDFDFYSKNNSFRLLNI